MVAQGALNQIVGQVFSRVRPEAKLARRGAGSSVPSSPRPNLSRTNSEAQIAKEKPNGRNAAYPSSDENKDMDETQAEKRQEVRQEQDAVEEPARKNSRTSTETIRPAAPDAVAAGEDTSSPAEDSATPTVPSVVEPSDSEPSESADQQAAQEDEAKAKPEKLTLANLESEAVAAGVDPTGQGRDGMRTPAPDAPQIFYSLNELHTKDAYLVFRALCKLGMKPLGVERCVSFA